MASYAERLGLEVAVIGGNEFIREMNRMDGSIDETADAMDDADKASQKTSSSLNKMVSIVRTFVALAAAQQFVRMASELIQIGAASQRTQAAFENISGGATNAAMNLEAMRRATRGAVSDTELMAQANRLLQMELATNAQELGRFTEMAVRLGTAMGRDASQSIEEFALLMANQSIPRLDTFGISAGNVRRRIDELTSSIEGMTREEAFNIAVMEEGEIAMARLGDQAEDSALQIERARASWQNLKTAVGEALTSFSAILGPITTVINLAGEYQRGWSQARAEMGDFERVIGTILVPIGMLDTMIRQLINTYEQAAFSLGELNAVNQLSAGQYADYAAMAEGAADATLGLGAAAIETIDPMSSLGDSVVEFGNALAGGIPSTREMFIAMVQMRAAAGGSREEIVALATAMGVATSSEIQATLAAQALAESYAQGAITANQAAEGASNLQRANELLTEAAEAAEAGNATLAASLRDQANDLIDLTGQVGNYTTALAQVPSNIHTSVTVSGLDQVTGPLAGVVPRQEGGPVTAGRPYIVGEGGAEMFVPRSTGTILNRDQLMRMLGFTSAGAAAMGAGGSMFLPGAGATSTSTVNNSSSVRAPVEVSAVINTPMDAAQLGVLVEQAVVRALQ